MTNYQKSLIYKLCSKDTNITDIYIGSTTSFRHRKSSHKSICNNEKSQKYNLDVYKFIRENCGWENWNMVLIEYYPCDTKLELEKREREIIENLKPTLNQKIPTRTNKEYKENNKEHLKEYYKDYYQDNKKKIKKQSNEYYQDNKEHYKEYMKNYREDNKEKKKEYMKVYRQKNKDKIKEYKKQYYQNNKKNSEMKRI